MFIEDLKEKVLIEPSRDFGCNELIALSGYSSALWIDTHLSDLNDVKCGIKLDLTIGMTGKDGLEQAELELLRKFDNHRQLMTVQ